MKKVLCITSGLTGIVNASMAFSDQLIKEGHEVTLACHIDISDRVNQYGFIFKKLPDLKTPYQERINPDYSKIRRLIYKYQNLKSRRIAAIESLHLSEFLEVVKEINPDHVYIDLEMHEYIIVLISNHYKVTLLSQWFSIWDDQGLPPIQSTIIPGVRFWGSKFGMWLAWQMIRIRRTYVFTKRKWVSGWVDRRSVVLDLVRQYNFPKKYVGKNYWPGPFLFEELPILAMVPKELEFPHTSKQNLTYLGPMVLAQRKEEAHPYREQLLKIIKDTENRGGNLICCTVSTLSSSDLAFLQKVVRTVEKSNDQTLILSAGALSKEIVVTEESRVHVFDNIPQLMVLAHADLSINHGGIHTINECLHFDVPMLIYSGDKSDQNGCAARVSYHRAGLVGDKNVDSTNDIQQKINLILNQGGLISEDNQVENAIKSTLIS